MKVTPVKVGGQTVALSYPRKRSDAVLYFNPRALEGLPKSLLKVDSRPSNGIYSERWVGTPGELRKLLARIEKEVAE